MHLDSTSASHVILLAVNELARMSAKHKGFDRDLTAHDGTRKIPLFPKRKSIRRLILAVLITAFLVIACVRNRGDTSTVEESILRYLSLTNEEAKLHNHSLESLAAGLRQCAIINQRPVSVNDEKRTNPRAVSSASPVVIKNATLMDGDGSLLTGMSILLSEGLIKEIGHDVGHPDDAKFIDACGRYISPGLVDMVRLFITID